MGKTNAQKKHERYLAGKAAKLAAQADQGKTSKSKQSSQQTSNLSTTQLTEAINVTEKASSASTAATTRAMSSTIEVQTLNPNVSLVFKDIRDEGIRRSTEVPRALISRFSYTARRAFDKHATANEVDLSGDQGAEMLPAAVEYLIRYFKFFSEKRGPGADFKLIPQNIKFMSVLYVHHAAEILDVPKPINKLFPYICQQLDIKPLTTIEMKTMWTLFRRNTIGTRLINATAKHLVYENPVQYSKDDPALVYLNDETELRNAVGRKKAHLWREKKDAERVAQGESLVARKK